MSAKQGWQALMGEAIAPYRTVRYNLAYELDPAAGQFSAHQVVMLRNDHDEPQSALSFLLHIGLRVDQAELRDALTARSFTAQMTSRPAAYRGHDYQLVTLALDAPIAAQSDLELVLRYHLDPSRITRGDPGALDSLTVDTSACYAVDAAVGHFPLLALGDVAALAAPYSLSIGYPDGSLSCVPGTLVASSTDGVRCHDVYDSPAANLPAFACAPYERVALECDGLSFELFHYPGQEQLGALLDTGLQLVQLYHDALGDNGVHAFQLATVGRLHERRPWAECRGSAIYFTDAGLSDLEVNLDVRQRATAMLAHELFHGWNLFTAPVDGPMSLWISEGLANWAAAWALERLYGPAAGAACRRRYAEAFIAHRGFEAASGLGYLAEPCSRPADWHLVYNGGALVWEQLCCKLGERAFLAGLQRFFKGHARRMSSAADLFEALQRRQGVEIGPYLEPWLETPPQISLSIAGVERLVNGDGCLTRVCLALEAPVDLEICTELGWRLAEDAPLQTMPVSLAHRGLRCLTISSDRPPTQVVIDPLHRVPVSSLDGLAWHE
jgi:hypothetical protein